MLASTTPGVSRALAPSGAVVAMPAATIGSHHQHIKPCRASRACPRAVVGEAASSTASMGRRAAALSLVGGVLALQGPAKADNCANLELQAQRGGGSAEDEAAAEACRRQYMSTTLDKGQLAEAGKAKSPSLAPNVPVATLDQEYINFTLKLIGEIRQYFTLDVYAKERIPLIKSMRIDLSSWVSKYARGGSARTQSARRMYIVCDSLGGFLANSGLAPLPAGKAKVLAKNLDEAVELLAKGL